MTKIDVETAAHVRVTLLRCQQQGRDPVRALDELGFLLYPDRRRLLIRDAQLMLADLMLQVPVRMMVAPGERVPTTPLDAVRAVESWVRKIAEGK